MTHAVALEPGGLLTQLYQDVPERQVTTIHHQCVDRLGQGLVVEARCPDDGVIEAVRHTGYPFVVGVQWHPEFQFTVQEANAGRMYAGPLLDAFLAAAAAQAATTA